MPNSLAVRIRSRHMKRFAFWSFAKCMWQRCVFASHRKGVAMAVGSARDASEFGLELATTNPQETSIRHLSRHLCRISRASPAKHSRFRCHTCRRQAVASAGRAVRSRAALPALPQRRWRQCSLHGRRCAMREPAEGRARLPVSGLAITVAPSVRGADSEGATDGK